MLAKKNNHGPELEAKLKKRVKAANKSGRLDLSTTPNCQFNFKYVPSLVYQTFGKNKEQQHTLAEQKKKEEEDKKHKRPRNEKASAAATAATAATTTTTAVSATVASSSSAAASSVGLRELWLSKNAISVLTRELYSLPSLQVLCLSDNNLTSVPSSIGDISTLRRLILNGNKITSVPADIMRCQKLEEIRLDNNRLSEFPLCLTELRNLVRLGLSRNKIGPTIPAQVRKLRKLMELDLDHNAITTVPSTLVFLRHTLQQLGLSYNRLSAVPECIKELTKLDIFRIQGNRVHKEKNADTGTEETHYEIPTRHDGYLELRTGEHVVDEAGISSHVIHKLPGYLEESFLYNQMNANWLRNHLRVSEQLEEVSEVNLLKNRALRKPQRIKSEEGKLKGRAKVGTVGST